eukprot:1897458-Rhodomonas_salina.3
MAFLKVLGTVEHGFDLEGLAGLLLGRGRRGRPFARQVGSASSSLLPPSSFRFPLLSSSQTLTLTHAIACASVCAATR